MTLIDLPPTLVDGLSLPPDPRLQGTSLLPLAFRGAEPRRTIYATTRTVSDPKRIAGPRSRLEADPWRAVWDRKTLETELYRDTDTFDQHDLAEVEPMQTLLMEQALLMRRALNLELLKGLGGGGETEALDPTTIERLKALGYL